MSRRLSPETLLSVHLGGILSRNRFTKNPAPVIAELTATAGQHVEILQEEAGTWIGFYEGDDSVRVLRTALRELPGLESWIAVGIERRAIPDRRTPGPPRGPLSASAWPRSFDPA